MPSRGKEGRESGLLNLTAMCSNLFCTLEGSFSPSSQFCGFLLLLLLLPPEMKFRKGHINTSDAMISLLSFLPSHEASISARLRKLGKRGMAMR